MLKFKVRIWQCVIIGDTHFHFDLNRNSYWGVLNWSKYVPRVHILKHMWYITHLNLLADTTHTPVMFQHRQSEESEYVGVPLNAGNFAEKGEYFQFNN